MNGKKIFTFFLFFATILQFTDGLKADSCYSYDACQYEEVPFVEICCPPACGRLSVTADYLYWRAHEDGLAYALTGLGTVGPPAIPPTEQGEVADIDEEWNSGYRVGVNYLFPCLCWDLALNYTHIDCDSSDRTDVPGTGAASSLWVVFGPPATGSATLAPIATADWNLHFQTFDLEIGRSFCWGNSFIFRTFGGIETIWTKDRYDIAYLSPPDAFAQFIHHKQNFCGTGPRIGLNNLWNVFKCLGLFADGSFSLVYGHYEVTREDTLSIPAGTSTPVNTRYSFHSLRPVFDFKVGVMAETRFFNCLRTYVKVAYETLLFLNHNQFLKFYDAGASKGVFNNINSNLFFHGLTVSAGIGF
jgi:hypothetical protein